MNTNVINSVEEAMNDEDFEKQLLGAEIMEAAREVFASRSIEFTTEEIEAITASLRASEGSNELSENDLDTVAGGVLVTLASVVSIVAGAVGVLNFVGKRCGWWK